MLTTCWKWLWQNQNALKVEGGGPCFVWRLCFVLCGVVPVRVSLIALFFDVRDGRALTI